MTNEERDLITRFVERVAGAAEGGAQKLPPIDPEADALITDLFTRHPEARYRLTQMAFLQEHALVEAQNRISRLQWELQQRQAAPPPAGAWGAGAPPPQQQRGFLSGLFGGNQAARRRRNTRRRRRNIRRAITPACSRARGRGSSARRCAPRPEWPAACWRRMR